MKFIKTVLMVMFVLPMLRQAADAQAAPVHPSVTLTCTAPATIPAGAYYNFFRGPAPGAEAAVAVLTKQATCAGTDLAVQANGTYYYKVAVCVINASGAEACGPMSAESNRVVVPLAQSDLPTPSAPLGTAN